jgi:immune inhibitor A
MAAGSWGGGGDTPVHPSAWCKANQGWVAVDNRTTNGTVNIPDVKDSHTVLRLWKDGAPSQEYFLVENRQRNRFDASLPTGGLLVWHIDEAISGNTNESHYKVALMQADGKRDLEMSHNRGDAGDAYPGSTGNTNFHNTSNPSSKSYGNVSTCVSITAITPPAAVMSANIAVKCTKGASKEALKDIKDIIDTIKWPIKVTDIHSTPVTWGSTPPIDMRLAQLEARLAQLESAAGRTQTAGGGQAQPFIGASLRPDLSASALAAEQEYADLHQQMQQGSAEAKRLYDSKLREG